MNRRIAPQGQNIFDACAKHIIKQGTQSLNSHGACVYLSKQNKSCAIGGPLVALGLYTPIMDSDQATVYNLTEGDAFSQKGTIELAMALNLWGVQESDLPLLAGIQRCHDQAGNDENFMFTFKNLMLTVAKTHKLSSEVFA